jgi:hypothetical protein
LFSVIYFGACFESIKSDSYIRHDYPLFNNIGVCVSAVFFFTTLMHAILIDNKVCMRDKRVVRQKKKKKKKKKDVYQSF